MELYCHVDHQPYVLKQLAPGETRMQTSDPETRMTSVCAEWLRSDAICAQDGTVRPALEIQRALRQETFLLSQGVPDDDLNLMETRAYLAAARKRGNGET